MARTGISMEQVEAEIATLRSDPDVRLQQRLAYLKMQRRMYLYGLRRQKKQGEELRNLGINEANLKEYFETGMLG